jgi:hypothetical protein
MLLSQASPLYAADGPLAQFGGFPAPLDANGRLDTATLSKYISEHSTAAKNLQSLKGDYAVVHNAQTGKIDYIPLKPGTKYFREVGGANASNQPRPIIQLDDNGRPVLGKDGKPTILGWVPPHAFIERSTPASRRIAEINKKLTTIRTQALQAREQVSQYAVYNKPSDPSYSKYVDANAKLTALNREFVDLTKELAKLQNQPKTTLTDTDTGQAPAGPNNYTQFAVDSSGNQFYSVDGTNFYDENGNPYKE